MAWPPPPRDSGSLWTSHLYVRTCGTGLSLGTLLLSQPSLLCQSLLLTPAAPSQGGRPLWSTAGAALGRNGDGTLFFSGTPKSGWFVMRTPPSVLAPSLVSPGFQPMSTSWIRSPGLGTVCRPLLPKSLFLPEVTSRLFWENSLPRGSSINPFSEWASSGWSHQFSRQPILPPCW